jgi:hypothetical protein
MKYLLGIALLVLMTSLCTQRVTAQELVPLSDYIATNGFDDKANVSYVLLRCSSVYNYLKVLLKDNGQDTSAHEVSAYRFLIGATNLRAEISAERGVDITTDEINLQHRDVVLSLTKTYIDISNTHWQSTGEHFSGSFIKGDMDLCKILLDRFN